MSGSTAYVEVAARILEKNEKELAFRDLWNAVCEELELSDEVKLNRISYFYTQLTLDGRFVTLGENVWDLRVRHTFDKVHIDMNDVYAEVEQEELHAEWEEEDENLDDEDSVDSYDDEEDEEENDDEEVEEDEEY